MKIIQVRAKISEFEVKSGRSFSYDKLKNPKGTSWRVNSCVKLDDVKLNGPKPARAPSSPMTIHFCSSDGPVSLKTVKCRATGHLTFFGVFEISKP